MKSFTLFHLALAGMFVAGAFCKAEAQDTIRFVRSSSQPQMIEEQTGVDEPVLIEEGENKGNSYVRRHYRSYALYQDTVYSVVTRTDSVEEMVKTLKTDTIKNPRRHQIQMYLGCGWGSLNYRLTNGGTVTGAPLALAELDYAYFFHKNVGIGIGLRVSNTTSVARLNGYRQWTGVTDTDGETYDHTTYIRQWRERETMHTLDVPLSLQAQFYFNEQEKAGMYFDAGASLRITGFNRYNVKEGNIEDKGYYPATHLTLEQLHEFGNRDMRQVNTLAIKRLGAGVFGDLGFLFRVGKITDLAIGGYFQYTVTDMNPQPRGPLGFGSTVFTFMPVYAGAMATNEASAAHPWEAGLKIGLRIRPGKDKVTEKEVQTRRLVPVLRKDTSKTVVAREEAVKEIERDSIIIAVKVPEGYSQGKGKRAYNTDIDHDKYQYDYNIVYFDFDSPRLSDGMKKLLDNVIEILKADEDKVVVLDGHACKTGPSEYNMRLSERRADAVADYLEKHGIAKERMLVRYHGFKEPSSDKPHPLSKDRRVVVKVSKNEK